MSDVLVIARREVEEKRLIFIAAAAFACMAVLMPFVPGIHGSPREIIAVVSGVFPAGYALAVAVLLGGSIVGRDITAGRMSFYFARPVSGAAIWFGKLLAAALIIVVSYLIVALPGIVVGPNAASSLWRMDAQIIGIIAAITAANFILAHAIGTMVRSRSALIAFDFFAASASVLVSWLILRPLLDGAALSAVKVLAWAAGIALFIAFIAAGTWQLVDGRTDRRRSHAAFSKVLWLVVGVFLAGAGIFTAWIVMASPSDVDNIGVYSSGGNSALVLGTTSHRFDFQPAFLMNTATGDYERLGGVWRWEGTISRDGSTFVVVQRVSYTRMIGEVVVRSTKPGAPLVRTSIMVNGWEPIVMTDDGSRIAVAQGNNLLTIYDVAQRKSLGSLRLEARPNWMFFASPDVLKIFTADKILGSPAAEPRTIASLTYDVPSRTLRHLGQTTISARFMRLESNADASRVILYPTSVAPLLCDGATLQPIATLPRHRTSVFLRDGRIALVSVDRTVSLIVTDPNGLPQRTIDLGTGWGIYRSAEVGPGSVMVSIAEQQGGKSYRAVTVDVDRGVLRTQRDLVAAKRRFLSIGGDPRTLPERPEQLMTTKEKTLVSWNALTGETKTLVGR